MIRLTVHIVHSIYFVQVRSQERNAAANSRFPNVAPIQPYPSGGRDPGEVVLGVVVELGEVVVGELVGPGVVVVELAGGVPGVVVVVLGDVVEPGEVVLGVVVEPGEVVLGEAPVGELPMGTQGVVVALAAPGLVELLDAELLLEGVVALDGLAELEEVVELPELLLGEVELPVAPGVVPGGQGLELIPVWPGEVVEGFPVWEGEVVDGVPV